MIHFTLTPCKTKAAFSAKLSRGSLDLNKIKPNYVVVLDTTILLVIKAQNVEIVAHRHGELLFKNCTNLELMQNLSNEIFELGLKTPQAGFEPATAR
jgi:hypothetical protein